MRDIQVDTKHKQGLLPILSSAGFLFYAICRFISMLQSGATEEVLLPVAFAIAALGILLAPRKEVLSFIWVVGLFLVEYMITRCDAEWSFFRAGLCVVVLGLLLLNMILRRVKPAIVITRFAWLILWAVYAVVIVHMIICRGDYGFSAICLYIGFVTMLLFTMSQTLDALKVFSRVTTPILCIPVLCFLLCMFFPASSPAISSGALRIASKIPMLFVVVSSVFFCIYLVRLRKGEKGKDSKAIKLGLIASAAVVVTAAIFSLVYHGFYEKDIGVRQEKAKQAFYEQVLSQDEYNWGDVYDGEYYVSKDYMSYSIVQLSDDSMPVLFLSDTGVGAAAGTTRLVLYNEDANSVKAVLGEGNCLYIRGYVKADESHEYPLIYFSGGRQDVSCELIYELRGNELYLLGRSMDIFPYDSPEIDPFYSNASEEYEWNGQTVTWEEFIQLRDQALTGYEEIVWQPVK